MTQQRKWPNLKGWAAFRRQRRKALRITGGVGFAMSSIMAGREVRVRAWMAEIIGKPAAKRMKLLACVAGEHEDPQYVIIDDDVDLDVWLRLRGIPWLLWPAEYQDEFIH